MVCVSESERAGWGGRGGDREGQRDTERDTERNTHPEEDLAICWNGLKKCLVQGTLERDMAWVF